MKTKSILLAALVGAAASATMSASAVNFGFSFGLPVPAITTAPVIVAPAPIAETVPACPGTDYVWAPGYWSHATTGYVWVRGAWNYHPRVDYGRFHGHDFDHRADRR